MVNSLEDELIKKFGTPVSNTGSEIKFICPKCGHKSLVASLDAGVFYCFVCFFGKGEKPLIASKTTSSRTRVDHNMHLRVLHWLCDNLTLSNEHRKYLKERGLYNPDKYRISTVPFQVEAHLQRVFTIEELLASGFFKPSLKSGITGWPALKPDRIFIPYWVEDSIIGCKTRVDPLDFEQEPKYAIPFGSKIAKHLWCPKPLCGDVIITEGEFKAAAACDLGFTAASTNGINGASAAVLHLPKYIKKGKIQRIFIIYDNEIKPNEVSLSTFQAEYLAKTLPNAVKVTLPLLTNQTKQDLDSFLVSEGEEDLYFLLEQAWKTR